MNTTTPGTLVTSALEGVAEGLTKDLDALIADVRAEAREVALREERERVTMYADAAVAGVRRALEGGQGEHSQAVTALAEAEARARAASTHYQAESERRGIEATGLRNEVRALRAVIAWALGEEGDFPTREPGEGAFWWRTELTRRARAVGTQAGASR